jgi:hypothetical protein
MLKEKAKEYFEKNKDLQRRNYFLKILFYEVFAKQKRKKSPGIQ